MGSNSNPVVKLIEIDLIRIAEHPTYGTYGVLSKANIPFCCTCELPWRDNKKKISRIPAGQYLVTRYQRPSKEWVFLVNNVPHREMVEIHVANLASELEGCIAVGNAFDQVKNKKGVTGPGVSSSRVAFFELVAASENQSKWLLNISDRMMK